MKIGQGRENAKLYLSQNPDAMEEISEKVRESFGVENMIHDGIENSVGGDSLDERDMSLYGDISSAEGGEEDPGMEDLIA